MKKPVGGDLRPESALSPRPYPESLLGRMKDVAKLAWLARVQWRQRDGQHMCPRQKHQQQDRR